MSFRKTSAFYAKGSSGVVVNKIQGNMSLWVSPLGDSSNPGTPESPLPSISSALEKISGYHIDENSSVTIKVLAPNTQEYNNDENRSNVPIKINHPDGKRIFIEGADPIDVPIQHVTVYGKNDSSTGGYFAELLVSNISGIKKGDFICIEEPNYTDGITGGPSIYEVDFDSLRMAVHPRESAQNLSGVTYDDWEGTFRKHLMLGPHEVVDTHGFTSEFHPNRNAILLFIRHENPWYDERESTEKFSAFVTPQGIRLVETNVSSGQTLFPYSLHNISVDVGTPGVTGAYDTKLGGVATEDFFTSTDRRHVNLRGKVYRSRVNFEETNGFEIETSIGNIKNMVLCGPAHSIANSGGTYSNHLCQGVGVHLSPYSNCRMENCAITGFEKGIEGRFAQCEIDHCFFSNNIHHIKTEDVCTKLKKSYLTGSFSDSIHSTNSSSEIDSTVICCSGGRGVLIDSNSLLKISNTSISFSWLDAIHSENSVFHLLGSDQPYGGATSDSDLGIYEFFSISNNNIGRFYTQPRNGPTFFRNKGCGIRLNNSTTKIYGSVVSYNAKGGIVATDSSVEIKQSNSWGNIESHSQEPIPSEISITNNGTLQCESSSFGNSILGVHISGSFTKFNNTFVLGNTGDGLIADVASIVRLVNTGITANNNNDIRLSTLSYGVLDDESEDLSGPLSSDSGATGGKPTTPPWNS